MGKIREACKKAHDIIKERLRPVKRVLRGAGDKIKLWITPVKRVLRGAGDKFKVFITGAKSRLRGLSKRQRAFLVSGCAVFVLAATFAGTFLFLDYRITKGSVGIVPDDGSFESEVAPMPEIEPISEDERNDLDEDELTDEEERQAIEDEFEALNGYVDGVFRFEDQIIERVEISGDVYNILIFGDDARINQPRGRSDAIILASVNRVTNEITLTSVIRSTFVPQRIGGDSWDRINMIYAAGGPGRAVNVFNYLFSLDVQRYVVLRFSSVFALVDRLGGLELELTAAEARAVNRIFPEFDPLEKGMNLMNGRQVLAYSRLRALDSDFVRVTRQRQVISAAINRVLEEGNFGDVLTLLSFGLDHVETNIPLAELITLTFEVFSGGKPEISELRIPVGRSYYEGLFGIQPVLVINFGMNIRAIHNQIYGNSQGVRVPAFVNPEVGSLDPDEETEDEPEEGTPHEETPVDEIPIDEGAIEELPIDEQE